MVLGSAGIFVFGLATFNFRHTQITTRFYFVHEFELKSFIRGTPYNNIVTTNKITFIFSHIVP